MEDSGVKKIEEWAEIKGHVDDKVWIFNGAKAFGNYPMHAEITEEQYDAATFATQHARIG